MRHYLGQISTLVSQLTTSLLLGLLALSVHAQTPAQATPAGAAADQSLSPPYSQFPFSRSGQFMFYSSWIDQLRAKGIHLQNSLSRFHRPDDSSEAAKLVMQTRAWTPSSQGGVSMTIAAWADASQATAHLKKRLQDGIASAKLSQRGVFSLEVEGPQETQATQLAAIEALRTYSPPSFELLASTNTSLIPRDLSRWVFVNTGVKNYGDYMHGFWKEYPDSIYRANAEQALAAYPVDRGAIVTTDTDACKASIKRALNAYRAWPASEPIPANAFLRSDVLELGTKGRSLEDTPSLERLSWALAIPTRGAPGSCYVHDRYVSFGSSLPDCYCSPLANTVLQK